MAKKCKACDPHEICEECPEWIFTLADLIMCMMGLFVVLWVLKPSPTPPPMGTVGEINKQQEKLNDQIAEIRAAFGYVPDPNSSDPIDQAMVKKAMILRGQGEKGVKIDRNEAAEGVDPTVQTIREGKLNVVGTRVGFDRGSATLSAAENKTLDQIARQIVGMKFVVIVKGHAARDDFDADATPQAYMNVALRRAQTAADYLVRAGVSPDVLRVQGCSTFEPVRQRAYTSDTQAMNRRVEVYSTDVSVRDLQDPSDASVKPLEE